MTFVSGFEHDIFVCYADADNAILPPATRGWIDQLADVLATLLGQFGVVGPSIYWQRRGNQTSEAHLETLKRSATLVLVTSPAYMASPWRADSRFKAALRSFGDTSAEGLFVVERDRVLWDQNDYEDHCRHDRFWRVDRGVPRVLGSPDIATAKDPSTFYEVATDLANAIAIQLKRLGKPSESNSATNSAPKCAIYLAHGIDSVHDARADVQRHLEQAGFEIIPRGRLPGDAARFDEDVRRSLERTRVFVQLLGSEPADTQDVIPGGTTRRQYELARERGTDLEVFQWRDPLLDLSVVAHARHKELLVTETVRAESVSDFCAAVHAAAARPAPQPRSMLPTVFVDVPREHVSAVERLFARYSGVRWDWHEPRLTALRTLLRIVQGVILYWGNGESDRTQERYYMFQRHFRAVRKPLDRLLIYDGPPPGKPSFSGHGFPIANGRHGDEPELLRRFLEEISSVQG